MWYIYAIEYYSVIKKNKIMAFEAMWKDLEIVTLSKVSQTQKDKYMTPLVFRIFIKKQGTSEPISKTEVESWM